MTNKARAISFGVLAVVVIIAAVTVLPRVGVTGAPTTIRIYASSGDGNASYVGGRGTACDQPAFTAAQSAPSAIVNYTSSSTSRWVATGCAGLNGAHIARGFLSFDTTAIPANAVVTGATINLFVTGKYNQVNDGSDYVVAVRGQQASPFSLTPTDYYIDPNAVLAEGTDRADISTVSTSAYNTLTINPDGLSWISKAGYTSFALREGHDMSGVWPGYANGASNGLNVTLSENSGTSQDPYLEVTYEIPDIVDMSPPSIPSDVHVTNVTSAEVDLAWSPSTDDVGVAGYYVYRDGTKILTVTNTSVADKGLVPDTSYTYTVVSVDFSDKMSEPSESLLVSTLPKPAVPDGTIGYVGCSMTRDAVTGYTSIGGTRFWETQPRWYQGGSIGPWANDLSDKSKFWSIFRDLLVKHPDTGSVWWELCTMQTTRTSDTYDNAVKVLNEIKRRAPNVEVFVSSQPDYTDGYVCSIAGAGGPANMKAIADQIVSNGLAHAGPVIGPLSQSQLRDACHGTAEGMAYMGSQLLQFFGQ